MTKRINISSESTIQKILEELATKLFLDIYPDGEHVTLLGKTVEGLSKDEWVIMNIPAEVYILSQKLYQDRELLSNATGCKYCFACKKHWMQIPSKRESTQKELIDLAKRLLAEYEWNQDYAVSLCPNCCGNLKTDSDFDGLFYL